MTMKFKERNGLIALQLQQGQTCEFIGQTFGITKQRVHQITRITPVPLKRGGKWMINGRKQVRRAH